MPDFFWLRRALTTWPLFWSAILLFGALAAHAQAPPTEAGGPDAPGAVFLPTDLRGLQELALERNPALIAARESAGAIEAGVPRAGTRPDPIVMVGAMNVGLDGFDTGMPASMAPALRLSQTLPLAGKLGVRESIAESSHEIARHSVDEAEWRTRSAVAVQFHRVRALDAQIVVQQRTLELLAEFQTVARGLYAAGSGRQADILRADVEVARADADIARLETMREAERVVLLSLLDLPHDVDVGQLRLPDVPSRLPGEDDLVVLAEAGRPHLMASVATEERARLAIDLAERDIWPDLTISVELGRGGGEQSRYMGGLMLGSSIPIQRRDKQDADMAVARALSREAAALSRQAHATVRAEIGRILADLERAERLVALYRDEILPVSRANVTSSLSAYRVGDLDFGALIDAQLAVDRYERELEDQISQYGVGIERLEAAVGARIDGPRVSLSEMLSTAVGDVQ